MTEWTWRGPDGREIAPRRQTPDAFCMQADGRIEIQTLTKCRRESDVIDICPNI